MLSVSQKGDSCAMFQLERLEKILEQINKQKKVNTDQLAEQFGISKVTIRRDIDILAQKGLIIKTYGGAVSYSSSFLHEIPYSKKIVVNASAKQSVGFAAAQMISDGEIIILDAGSTTLEIAKHINQHNITVLTNDIKILNELAIKQNVNVMICGGILDKTVHTLAGKCATDFFEQVHVNKTFLGCDAVDFKFGISNRTFEEIDIKRAMIRAADDVIMVTDCSKLNRRVFAYLCDVADLSKLVINKIDDTSREKFASRGVEVIESET